MRPGAGAAPADAQEPGPWRDDRRGRRGGRERIAVARRHGASRPLLVERVVVHDVTHGPADLRRGPEVTREIMIRENTSRTPQRAVDSLGDANDEALDSPGERALVLGLDQQVDVVAKDREMRQPDGKALRPRRAGRLHLR